MSNLIATAQTTWAPQVNPDFAANPWEFNIHAEVWIVILSLAVGYWWMLTRVGPTAVPKGQKIVTKRQVISYYLGVFLTWVAADWPVHDLAEQYLYSMHMAQHLILSLIGPGLLMAGVPGWLIDRIITSSKTRLNFVRRLTNPFLLVVVNTAVVLSTHVPVVVNSAGRSGWLHFSLHCVIYVTGILSWFPVLQKSRSIKQLQPIVKCAYLFGQSIVSNVPIAFLTFATKPVYEYYTTVSRPWGISVVDDQQLAAAIMKVGAVSVIWGSILAVYFTAFKGEDRVNRSRKLIVYSDGTVKRADGSNVKLKDGVVVDSSHGIVQTSNGAVQTSNRDTATNNGVVAGASSGRVSSGRVSSVMLGAVTILSCLGLLGTYLVAKSDASSQTNPKNEIVAQYRWDGSYTDLDSNPVDMRSISTKPYVINFWASWCAPCKREFPKLRDVSDKVQVVGVVSDDSKTTARDFAVQNGADWPIIYDPSREVSERWRVARALPVTYAVDSSGVIKDRRYGELTDVDVTALLRSIGLSNA